MSRAFNRDMLRRYDGPGPRYTSYPTAPHFHDSFGVDAFREQASSSNAGLTPMSLYVHVPYCFSPCFYCGCNRLITRDPVSGERYLHHLLGEIERVASLFDADREVRQVHFGGGTPNFLSPEQLGEILESLGRHFRLSDSPERDFSIELDPRQVNPGDMSALAALGLNRTSLGIQDFDPDVQRAINRVQSVEQTLAVIEECRTSGMRSVNVDLIYGLPRQTSEGFGRTLETVIAVRPDRLAIYGYAHLPHMFKAQKQIRSEELPDAEQRLGLLQQAVDALGAAGYVYIGMDHFALPDDDLARAQRRGGLHRNFMGYTTHADCDLLGFGVSAISHIGSSFSQNQRDLRTWQAHIEAGHIPVMRGVELSDDDLLRASIIQHLMCQGRIDIRAIERQFNIDFDRYFSGSLARLRQLEDDGLLVMEAGLIQATPQGRYLLRTIAMCFDAYLPRADDKDNAPKYSKAI